MLEAFTTSGTVSALASAYGPDAIALKYSPASPRRWKLALAHEVSAHAALFARMRSDSDLLFAAAAAARRCARTLLLTSVYTSY